MKGESAGVSEGSSSLFIEVIRTIVNACHLNSKAKGFWDEGEIQVRLVNPDGSIAEKTTTVKTKPWNMGEKLALSHSEYSEWLEAYRKGVKFSEKPIFIDDESVYPDKRRNITAQEEEAADAFIRLADLCGKLNIDLGKVVLAKMQYNAGRPHMHGRKC